MVPRGLPYDESTCHESNSNMHAITYLHKMISISVPVHCIKLQSMLGSLIAIHWRVPVYKAHVSQTMQKTAAGLMYSQDLQN